MNLEIMALMLSKVKRIAGHLFFPQSPVAFNYINGVKGICSLPPLFGCSHNLPSSSRNSLLHTPAFFLLSMRNLKHFILYFDASRLLFLSYSKKTADNLMGKFLREVLLYSSP